MISPGSEIIVLSLALNKKQMESINMVPKGTRALLVNFDNRSCMHTITSLYDAGYRDVELIPYCGEEEYDHSIMLAITPNEAHLVPKGIETVINVGESSVSMNSLYEIADKLGVYEEFSSGEAAEARKEYYYINSGLDRLFAEKISVTDKLSTLIRLMNEGIVITDVFGKIYLSNEKADLILKHDRSDLNGVYIEELLPGIILDTKKEKIIKIIKDDADAETPAVSYNYANNDNDNYINIKGALILAFVIALCFVFYLILLNKNLLPKLIRRKKAVHHNG